MRLICYIISKFYGRNFSEVYFNNILFLTHNTYLRFLSFNITYFKSIKVISISPFSAKNTTYFKNNFERKVFVP